MRGFSDARRMAPWLLSAAIYVALTAIVGNDVLRHLDSRIANDPGDPLLTAAILSWNSHHLPLTDPWWQFPIFYPTRDVLAFSENLLGLSPIATPLNWITGSPLAAYNLTLLLTFPLSALAMYALVQRLTRSSIAAFLAGLAFGFSLVRTSQLPHIQNLALFYMPLLLLGLHAFVETGRRRWLLLVGWAWLMQGAANAYMLVYGAVLVACWLGWFAAASHRWRALGAIVVTIVIATIPLVPVIVRYSTVHRFHGFRRGPAEAALFSADVMSLLCAPERSAFWGWLRVACRSEGELFPGVALVLICLLGALALRSGGEPAVSRPMRAAGARALAVRVRRGLWIASGACAAIAAITVAAGPWSLGMGALRLSSSTPVKPASLALGLLVAGTLLLPGLWPSARRGSIRTFYLVVALATWVLAWGPAPTFYGVHVIHEAPFAWLMRLPGGSGVRVPARFWLLSMLCLAVLMGLLVTELLKRRSQPAKAALVMVAAAGLLLDGWAWIPAAPVPSPVPRPDLLRGSVVLELPIGDLLRDVAAVHRAVSGGWQTVNGFSGNEPAGYDRLRKASADGDAAAILRDLAVSEELHVLVSDDAPERLRRSMEDVPASERVGQSNGLTQYRVAGRASETMRLPVN